MEHIELINSLDSKLQIYSICSVRIRSRNRDIFENINICPVFPKYLILLTKTSRGNILCKKIGKLFEMKTQKILIVKTLKLTLVLQSDTKIAYF